MYINYNQVYTTRAESKADSKSKSKTTAKSKEKTKASKNTVGIENYQGRIRLNIPWQWSLALWNVPQKRVSRPLPYTPENLKFAETVASKIELAYLSHLVGTGTFDLTLAAYGVPITHLSSGTDTPPKLTLLALFEKWVQFLLSSGQITEVTYRNTYTKSYLKILKDAGKSADS